MFEHSFILPCPSTRYARAVDNDEWEEGKTDCSSTTDITEGISEL